MLLAALIADSMGPLEGTPSLIMVCGMAITGLGAFGTGVMNYLSLKTKLKFDTEFSLLKENCATLKEHHAECEKEHHETRQKLEDVIKRCETAEHTASKMEGELAGANQQIVQMKEDLSNLRRLLYSRTGGA